MNNNVLNDLKMLLNFDMDSKDKSVIVLVGLNSLNNLMNLVANEPLKQRIIANYNIDNYDKEETKNYIESKLKASSTSIEIFESNAIESIVNFSNSIPRMIDKYCDKCLLLGNNAKLNVIDAEIVLDTASEIEL